MEKSYSDHFLDIDNVAEYENSYEENTFSRYLWYFEKEIVAKVLDEIKKKKDRINYLDFACGTGRLISFVEGKVEHSIGIDTSPLMLELAEKKTCRSSYLCKNIANNDVEGEYDLITAFRFLLNIEDELRFSYIKSLVKLLKDKDSVLIINNHGNLWSSKFIKFPFHFVKVCFARRRLKGYLTNREVLKLFDKSGLSADKRVGVGFLPWKIIKLLPCKTALGLERKIMRFGVLSFFGINQIYICRLK